ncbi:anti-sigma factor antagonist [Herbaspirillum sp. HC18]|nr:anti-sigma factor antagonist [Herbaspirillum sp. HC18]
MTSAQHPAGTCLRIEGEMTIYKAAELKQSLLAAIVPQATLEIDLSAVTELDTAGLQLLMLAKKAALAAQGDIRLGGQSDAVIDVFDLLNLGTYFDDPLVIPSRTAAPNSNTR